MTNKVMLTGPHAIGKTTTAKAVSKAWPDSMFAESVASLVAARVDFNIDAKNEPQVIAAYQMEVAKAFKFQYECLGLVNTIFDRSPLDLAVYMRLGLEKYPAYEDVVTTYTDYCIELVNEYCDVLFVVDADPSEAYEDKPGRPTFTKDQIELRRRYSLLIEELVSKVSKDVVVLKVPTEKQYEDRTNFILGSLELLLGDEHE